MDGHIGLFMLSTAWPQLPQHPWPWNVMFGSSCPNEDLVMKIDDMDNRGCLQHVQAVSNSDCRAQLLDAHCLPAHLPAPTKPSRWPRERKSRYRVHSLLEGRMLRMDQRQDIKSRPARLASRMAACWPCQDRSRGRAAEVASISRRTRARTARTEA